MHLPASALPGAQGLLLDGAGQQLQAQAFGRRPSPQPAILQEAPTVAALIAPWADFGAPARPVSYYKDAAGFVHLQGLVKSGVLGTTAFTLKAGYRPAGTLFLATVSNGAFGSLTITAAGDVVPGSGSNVWFSLDSISFRPAA